MLAHTIINLIIIFYGNKFGSYKKQLILSFFVLIIVLITIPLIVIYVRGLAGFLITYFFITCLGIIGAFIHCSIYGIISILPAKYIIAMSTGQGCAGIILVVLKFIILAAYESRETKTDEQKEAVLIEQIFIFISIGILIILVSIAMVFILFKNRYYLLWLKETSTLDVIAKEGNESPNKRNSKKRNSVNNKSDKSLVTITEESHTTTLLRESSTTSLPDIKFDESEKADLSDPDEDDTEEIHNLHTKVKNKNDPAVIFKQVFIKILDINILGMLNFFVHGTITPSLVVQVKSLFGLNYSYSVLLIILLSNLAETLGRFLPRFLRVGKNKLFLIGYFRILFIFLFILLSASWMNGFDNFFTSDVYALICILLSMISAGYCISLVFALAPKFVPDNLKHKAGVNVGFFMYIGWTLAFANNAFLLRNYLVS